LHWLAQPIADTLVKEVAKPAKDSVTEVVRSGDFLSYTAGDPPARAA
jgi:glyceraldehyde-3-phosphate dehydrogenase (NADP+)